MAAHSTPSFQLHVLRIDIARLSSLKKLIALKYILVIFWGAEIHVISIGRDHDA